MKIQPGRLAALALAALTAACASAATGGNGGGNGPRIVVPPPDVTCSTGRVSATPIADSVAGQLALMSTQPDSLRPTVYARVLEQARRAIAADPDNAYGYYLAGNAALNLNRPLAADSLFERAVALCPELGPYDIENLLRQGAARSYNRGLTLFQSGDTASAVQAWEAAIMLDPNNTDSEFYLGLVGYERRQTQVAEQRWTRVVEVLRGLPADSSATVNRDRADMLANTYNALTAVAIQYLQREMYQPAAALLQRLGEWMPRNADIWYHHALALNGQQRWRDLVSVGQRATELAPLHYSAWTLFYNGYAGQAQVASQADQRAQAAEFTRLARQVSQTAEGLPVNIQTVRINSEGDNATVSLQVLGMGPRNPVQVEFTLYGLEGPVGTQVVTINPPADDGSSSIEATVPVSGPVVGWSYRRVGG